MTGRPVALTGTPGVGKSSVARRLPKGYRAEEVGRLALRWGVAEGSGRDVVVDLPRLARRLAARPPDAPQVVVGHLAHLLPVDDVVVLRCDPVELGRRLRSARRGTSDERHANVEAEATDVVLLEALRRGLRTWEVDTTGKGPATVAREVERLLRRRPASRYGAIDWLSDPLVTEYLLRRRP